MRICDDLRAAVLQSAMSGHLTYRYQTDEDINEYYHALILNKQKNVEGKIWKKENPVEEIDNSEFEYELRDNWRWCYLGNIVCVRGGKRIPAGRTLSNNVTTQKYIRVSDMKNHSVDIFDIKFVPEDLIETLSSYRISKNDLYITVAGTIGDIGEIPPEVDDANLTENADKLVFENIDKKWLMYCLLSNCIKTQIKEATTKVGQPKLAIKRIQSLSIPLPPLAEQHRIVTRVDELMAKIDELEKVETQLESLKKNFPGDMKAALLQAAIQGKLTEHSWNEDDTPEIYKPLWSITAWDKKFKAVDKKKQSKVIDYYYYLAADMRKIEDSSGDVFLLSTGDYSGWTTEEKAGDTFRTGEIVSIPWGGYPNVKYYKGKFVTTDNRIATSIDTDRLLNRFLYYFMLSKVDYLDSIYRGTSLRHPDMAAVLDMQIPLPSVEEQQRIVDKLDRLLPLCEGLYEEKLQEAV